MPRHATRSITRSGLRKRLWLAVLLSLLLVADPMHAQPYYTSRAEAAALLLRRTRHSSGAKHFGAGGITIHATDLVLSSGLISNTLPNPLRMDIVLLGHTVHSFNVDLRGARREGEMGPDVLRLGQVVNYEVPPEELADQLAALPRLEFRLYAQRPEQVDMLVLL